MAATTTLAVLLAQGFPNTLLQNTVALMEEPQSQILHGDPICYQRSETALLPVTDILLADALGRLCSCWVESIDVDDLQGEMLWRNYHLGSAVLSSTRIMEERRTCMSAGSILTSIRSEYRVLREQSEGIQSLEVLIWAEKHQKALWAEHASLTALLQDDQSRKGILQKCIDWSINGNPKNWMLGAVLPREIRSWDDDLLDLVEAHRVTPWKENEGWILVHAPEPAIFWMECHTPSRMTDRTAFAGGADILETLLTLWEPENDDSAFHTLEAALLAARSL